MDRFDYMYIKIPHNGASCPYKGIQNTEDMTLNLYNKFDLISYMKYYKGMCKTMSKMTRKNFLKTPIF